MLYKKQKDSHWKCSLVYLHAIASSMRVTLAKWAVFGTPRHLIPWAWRHSYIKHMPSSSHYLSWNLLSSVRFRVHQLDKIWLTFFGNFICLTHFLEFEFYYPFWELKLGTGSKSVNCPRCRVNRLTVDCYWVHFDSNIGCIEGSQISDSFSFRRSQFDWPPLP